MTHTEMQCSQQQQIDWALMQYRENLIKEETVEDTQTHGEQRRKKKQMKKTYAAGLEQMHIFTQNARF